MSGVYCTEQKLVGVWCHSMHDPAIINLLQQYQCLLQRLVGPKAGMTLIQHIGGIDSYVNSSSELIKRLNPHHPCIKFINCLMESQNVTFGCCGLYVGSLCSSLLKELLIVQDNQGVPERVVKHLAALLMEDALRNLEEKPQTHVTKLELSSLDQIMAYVATHLGSKNLGLSLSEKDHLKVKVVDAFLKTVNDINTIDSFGDVSIITVPGRPTTEADVVQGVLYRYHDPNVKLVAKLQQILNDNSINEKGIRDPAGENDDSFVSRSTKFSISNYIHNHGLCETEKIFKVRVTCLRVVLFNVPLAFQKSDTQSLKYIGGLSNNECYDSTVLMRLRALIQFSNVNIIACQKFVSENIKFELERDGVLLLERLGTSLTEALQKLTRCVIISDVSGFLNSCNCLHLNSSSNVFHKHPETWSHTSSCPIESYVGYLTHIKVIEICGKTYLQLNYEKSVEDHNKHLDTSELSEAFQEINLLDLSGVVHSEQLINDSRLTDAGMSSQIGKPQLPSNDSTYSTNHSNVATLILPAISSVLVENLKVLVQECLHSLRQLALQPVVVAAGGCVEAWLAQLAASAGARFVDVMRDSAEESAVSAVHLKQVASAFYKTFVNLSAVFSGGVRTCTFDLYLHPHTGHLLHLPPEGDLIVLPHQQRRLTCSCSSPVTVADRGSLVPLRNLCDIEIGCVSDVENSSKCGIEEDKFMDVEKVIMSELKDGESPICLNKSSETGGGRVRTQARVEDLARASCDPGEGATAPPAQFKVTEGVLVEHYYGKLNAVRLAFEGVIQLLDVDCCIFDR